MRFPCCSLACVWMLFSVNLEASASGTPKADYLDLRLMIGRGEYLAAFERCKDLVSRHPGGGPFYKALAEVAQYAGKLDDAVEYLRQRIVAGDSIALAYYGLGCTYFLKKDDRSAIICYGRAIGHGVRLADCYRGLEYAYERLEGVDAAVRFFRELSQREPENPNAWYALGLAYWNIDYGRALSALQASARMKGSEPCIRQVLSSLRVLTDKRVEVREYMEALVAEAESASDLEGAQFLRTQLAQLLLREICFSEAKELCERTTSESEKYGLLRWLAWSCQSLAEMSYVAGDFVGLHCYIERILEISSKVHDDDLLQGALGLSFEALLTQGNYRKAFSVAVETLNRNRTRHRSRDLAASINMLSRVQAEIGLQDLALVSAIEALHVAERIAPDSSLLGSLHSHLGYLYESARRVEAAAYHYSQAHAFLNSTTARSVNLISNLGNLGRAQQRLGKVGLAYLNFSRQLTLARRHGFRKEEAAALYDMASLRLQQGRREVAAELLSGSLRMCIDLGLVPLSLRCREALSKIYAASGDTLQAIHQLQSIINLTRSSDSATGGLYGATYHSLDQVFRSMVRLLCGMGKIREAYAASMYLSTSSVLSTPFYRFSIRPILLPTDEQHRVLRKIAENVDFLASSTRGLDLPIPPLQRLECLAELAEEQNWIVQLADASSATRPRPPFDPLRACSDVAQVQGALTGRQAIVRYLVFEDATEMLFLGRDTVLHHTIRISSDSLTELLKSVCCGTHSTDFSVHVVSPLLAGVNIYASYEAYKILLGPVESLLGKTGSLLILPDKQLRNLAFEALVTRPTKGGIDVRDSLPSFLVKQLDIQYALESGEDIVGLTRHPLPTGEVLVLTADDEGHQLWSPFDIPEQKFESASERLSSPWGETFSGEANAVLAARVGVARSVRSSAAAESTLAHLARGFSLVHIAAHYEIDVENPYLGSLIWAPATNGGGGSRSSAHRMAWSKLNGSMVFLSGCNTARAIGARYERPLVDAFVSSGSTRILGCLWNLDEKVSGWVAKEFYSQLGQGKIPTRALRETKLALMRSGYVDPFYWAGIVLFSDSFDVDEDAAGTNPKGKGESILPLLALVAFFVGVQCCMPWIRGSGTQRL